MIRHLAAAAALLGGLLTAAPAQAQAAQPVTNVVVDHWVVKGRTPQSLLDAGHQVANLNGGVLYYVLGATLSIWPDNSGSETPEQVEANVAPSLRALAQKNWGGPDLAGSWAALQPYVRAIGGDPSRAVLATDVPRQNLRVAGVDSEETASEDGRAARVIDGDPATFWHSRYSPTTAPLPHDLRLDLGEPIAVSGLRYLPRQDAGPGAANGRIKDYEVYVSADGATWGAPVATGTFADDAAEKLVTFPARLGRYVRLRALSEVQGRPWTTAAEVTVVGNRPSPISRTGHRAVASSQTADHPAASAVDGEPFNPFGLPASTFWLSEPASGGHEFRLDLGIGSQVSGLRYFPRQDGSREGRIKDYEVYVSANGTDWGTPVATGTFADDAKEKELVFPARTARYVKLRAVSERTAAGRASAAEITVLGGPVPELPRTGWTATADSEETAAENGAAANVLDGDPATIWHTRYAPSAAPMPHEVRIDTGAARTLTGLRYLPRQDTSGGAANGRVKDYEVYVSANGADWGTPVAAGAFADDAAVKEVTFAPRTGRHVRLRILSEVNGNPWATAAEITLLG